MRFPIRSQVVSGLAAVVVALAFTGCCAAHQKHHQGMAARIDSAASRAEDAASKADAAAKAAAAAAQQADDAAQKAEALFNKSVRK